MTAVHRLIANIRYNNNDDNRNISADEWELIYSEAIEDEAEQIIDAFKAGRADVTGIDYEDAHEYYIENYVANDLWS